jgi:hypothetical protein
MSDNDLEKDLLKIKMELQSELIKKRGKNPSKIQPVKKKDNVKIKLSKKKINNISAKELGAKVKKEEYAIDTRLIKTPLDVLFYNYDFKIDSESTPYLKFLSFLFSQDHDQAKKMLEFLPEEEEKVFNEFIVNFFISFQDGIRVFKEKNLSMGKYKDLVAFMVMAYAVGDFKLILEVSEKFALYNNSLELRFLNSINSYILKNDVIEIIPDVIISLRKFPKSYMLNNIVGYVNFKKGDPYVAKDYFLKSKSFLCSYANLEESEYNNIENNQEFLCPKILYLRIRRMLDLGEIETAKSMIKNFKFEHPYKFLSYFYLYGSEKDNDEKLLKYMPRAKFYFKSRLLANIELKSMKLVDAYRQALSEKLSLEKKEIKVEIDIDTYEFFYQILGGIYCKLNKHS